MEVFTWGLKGHRLTRSGIRVQTGLLLKLMVAMDAKGQPTITVKVGSFLGLAQKRPDKCDTKTRHLSKDSWHKTKFVYLRSERLEVVVLILCSLQSHMLVNSFHILMILS